MNTPPDSRIGSGPGDRPLDSRLDAEALIRVLEERPDARLTVTVVPSDAPTATTDDSRYLVGLILAGASGLLMGVLLTLLVT